VSGCFLGGVCGHAIDGGVTCGVACRCVAVFVAPYMNPSTETFGVANVEALSMSLPVLHFGVGGLQVGTQCPVPSVMAPPGRRGDDSLTVVSESTRHCDLCRHRGHRCHCGRTTCATDTTACL
jgi:hypothetical protein